MSKFLVETHYTCTFKIIHELDELNEKSLSEVDNRKDGKVEIVNVTVNNRKTKKSDGKNIVKSDLENLKISHSQKSASYEKVKTELSKKNDDPYETPESPDMVIRPEDGAPFAAATKVLELLAC